jgi:Mg-chelatase subunit ChlD
MASRDAPERYQPFIAQPDSSAQAAELPAGWEAAQHFHRLKGLLPPHLRRIVEERAVEEILGRARALLRHTSRPTERVEDRLPADGELDLEATLEQPLPWQRESLVLSRVQPREVELCLMLDMSLSMTGEKVALTALAAAILKLKLERVSVIAFDTVAHRLVRAGEELSARELVRRILGVPAQGYTNIEAGLLMGVEELGRARLRERVGVILTDGVANVGWDPVRVAPRFPRLHVVQVGREERQGTRTCERLARAGRGLRYRAVIYAQLPAVVRELVRDCFGV